MQYFGGTSWSCVSFGGSNESHDYAADGARGFGLHVIFHVAPQTVRAFDERYSYDQGREEWTVTLGEGSYLATSSAWSSRDWVLTGFHTSGGMKLPFRMIYHMYDQGVFRRDFQTRQGGRWITYSGETCEQRDVPQT